MGVYDHLMRPSMGHKMQVELKDSMERYHDNKHHLQQHFAELRFGSKDLHTSSGSSSPEPPPVRKWGDPGSKFNKAPEKAAQKARLAQLQQENSHLTNEQTDDGEQRTRNSFLPPIPYSDSHKPTPAKDVAHLKEPANHTEVSTKPEVSKTGSRTKKAEPSRGRKLQKKAGVKKNPQPKEKPLPVLKLPTIYSAGDRRTIWDSGQTHLNLKVPSTHLEKNQVDEDCRNFKHWSKTIPTATDAKRTEIHRTVRTQHTGASSRVQFRRHPNPPPAPNTHNMAPGVPAEANISRQATTVDHFPKNQPRLPELEDGSSEEEEDSEDEVENPRSKEQARRTTLPAIPTATSTKPSDHSQPATLGVPPLRLRRGMTPSAVSTGTMQSGTTGATYMSQMSQDIREWKGAYMNTEDPYYKGRMLMEILHATRQRMQDNAEDLRLSGDFLPHKDGWGTDGKSEVMLLHRDSTTDSLANTARSSVPQSQVFKLPRYNKKRAAGRRESQNAKLHRYLNKLTNQRKAGGEPRHHQRRAPFPLATMTIREITQTSLEHQSAVQTAS